MKTSYIFGVALAFIIFVFVLAAASNLDHPTASARSMSAASQSLQITTPTPPVENISEVGSTDGIVITGVVIVIIVTLPVLFRKKKK
jgi:hypothetical protein